MKDGNDIKNSNGAATAHSDALTLQDFRCLHRSYKSVTNTTSNDVRIKIFNERLIVAMQDIADADQIPKTLHSGRLILNRIDTEDHFEAKLLAAETSIRFIELAMNEYQIEHDSLKEKCTQIREMMKRKFPEYTSINFAEIIRDMTSQCLAWKDPEREIKKIEEHRFFEIKIAAFKSKRKPAPPKLSQEEFEAQKKKSDAACAELLKEEEDKAQLKTKKENKKKLKNKAKAFFIEQSKLAYTDKSAVRKNLEEYYKDRAFNKPSLPMPKEIISTYISASLPLFRDKDKLEEFISCGAWLVTLLNQSQGWNKDRECLQLIKQFLFCLNALHLNPEIISREHSSDAFFDITRNARHQKEQIASLLLM